MYVIIAIREKIPYALLDEQDTERMRVFDTEEDAIQHVEEFLHPFLPEREFLIIDIEAGNARWI